MEGASFKAAKTWVMRVDIDEDVLECVERFIADNGIRQGYIAAGYGTLKAASLHWVCHNRLPTDNLFSEIEGGIEILSISGIIAEGQVHIHVSLATPVGAFGGHLEPGSKAYVLCEIVIVELEGPRMRKPRVEIGTGEDGKPVSIPRLTFGGESG